MPIGATGTTPVNTPGTQTTTGPAQPVPTQPAPGTATPVAPGAVAPGTAQVQTPAVGPAAPGAQTKPQQPAKPRDVYGKPAPIRPQPNLAGPTSLGTIGGSNVVVGQDGSIGLGVVPTSLSEQIRAAQKVILEAPDAQPLSSVTDPQTVRTIAFSAAKLYEACLKTPRNDGEALEFRAGRAAALGLIEAAARRANGLGDKKTRDQLTLGLLFSLQQEPHRGLKGFAFNRLLQLTAKGEIGRTVEAEAALYPQKPPYEKWRKDGVLRVVHYTDNNGSPREGNIEEYLARGYKRTDNPDGSTTMTLEARGKGQQALKTEVIIPPAPTHDAPPSIFEHMGDDSVDMIIYAGHAGYGKRVDDALSKGVQGTGDGKLIMLMQCYGEGSIESINRAFPDAHLISTRRATDDNYDFTLMDELWKAADQGHSYGTIMKNTEKVFTQWVSELTPEPEGSGMLTERDIQSYKDHPISQQYFMPDHSETLLQKIDRDRDGIQDVRDTAFNVVYPKRIDGTGGYDPLDPGAPLAGLDGVALNRGTNQLNLLMARYGALPEGLLGGRVPWNPDVFQPAGFYEGEPGDLRAFKFELDAAAGRVRVRANSNFAHAGNDALGRMLALEAGAFIAEKAGLEPAKAAALQLSFLERMLHQEGPDYAQPFSPGSDAARQEYALMQRYGLPLTFSQLTATSGNPDDFAPATFDALLAKVQATPGLERLGALDLKRVGEPLTVTQQNLVINGRIDGQTAKDLLRRLNAPGELDEARYSTQWLSEGVDAKRVVFPMKDAEGKSFIVSLGLDADGVLRSAVKLGTS